MWMGEQLSILSITKHCHMECKSQASDSSVSLVLVRINQIFPQAMSFLFFFMVEELSRK